MRFFAYGLTIESEVRISGMPLSETPPEAIIRLCAAGEKIVKPNAGNRFKITPDGFCIHWCGAGTFLIRKGCEILIEPQAGVEEAIIRLILLGPALAMLLHQRGVLVLHASVVSINDCAVGFMGEKGWGKSTTAAAFNAKGHALVADDILAVIPGVDGTPMVQPGPPHFKLWPEAAAASFGDNPDVLARVHSRIEKRERSANTGHIAEPLPLRHLYVLDNGDQLESIPMPPAVALLALVRHSYLSGIMNALGGLQKNFQQCAQLAAGISVSSLKRPKDLGALGSIVELVEHDIGTVDREEISEMILEAL
jgi:hypothetical protein